MKKITFIFLFLCSISFGQNLGNPAIIGQTNRNQKVGKGLQVTDTLITDGVVILKNLATFGSGVDTGVGFKNGKIVRFLNTGGVSQTTLNDSITAVRSIRKVDTIYRNSDSIVFKINGILYSFKDSSGTNSGGIQSIQEGTNITVDNTDPENPIISATDNASALFPNGLDVIEASRDFQSSDEGKLLVLFPGVNLTMPNSIVFTGLFRTIGIMQIDTTSWFEQEFGGTKIKSLTTAEFKHNEIVLCLTSVTDDDSASRLLFLSTTIIEEQTALKYLYDKSQNAIPLSGTEVGSPVTGDIETTNGVRIYSNGVDSGSYSAYLLDDIVAIISTNDNYTGYNSNITLNPNYVSFSSTNPLSVGLTGIQDFTPNITDLDYTQKIYVGFRGTAALSSGTVTVTTDKIKTGYKIYVSVNTPSGTQGFLSASTADIVDVTSFVINSTSVLDNSTVNWWIAP